MMKRVKFILLDSFSLAIQKETYLMENIKHDLVGGQ